MKFADSEIPLPILRNIVSSVTLGTRLDLKKIAMSFRNAEYDPKRFRAVVMRIREPRTTALIFATGKLICIGAKLIEDSKLACRKYVRLIQRLGFDVKCTEFKILNMVATFDLNFPIQLENLYMTHAQFSTYEPELFCGLTYRLIKPRVTLIIFVNGKIMVTGAKRVEDIETAFHIMHPTLVGFRKGARDFSL